MIKTLNQKCFASAKNSEYTLPRDRGKPEEYPSCYVLDDEAFMTMQFYNNCGCKQCPFFKPRREDVRRS